MDNLLAVCFSFSNVAFITNMPYDDEEEENNHARLIGWLMRNNWKDMIDITSEGDMVYDAENVMYMKTEDLNMPYIDYSITQMPYSPN